MKAKLALLLLVTTAPPGAADDRAAAGSVERAAAGSVERAAPGYVDDQRCAICHADLYQPYQEVGMARSFFRPSAEKIIEDFDDSHFFHAPSQRHYEMSWRDGRLLMKRYQLEADGEPIHVVEQEVHWVLGSGHTSRSYLFQTRSGELFQLPVAWYSQTASWGMAPGFDKAGHKGLARRTRRECMFCHNAYPDVPAASDRYWAPQTYPRQLPEGTGCQRCHGPGEEHVRASTEEMENKELVRSSIVNPGRLPPRLRDDVCDQCHLQPSVALSPVRRFGRDDYSFRAGQRLADYMVLLDVDVQGTDRSERFEINHHPYRLRQSRCYQKSGRELSCLTCHDPHRKVPEERRAEHYRAACLSCHQAEACGLPHVSPQGASTSGGAAPGAAASAVDPGDCAACHMPKRRTQDVVQVVMTDHRIRRVPGGEELLAPVAESDQVVRKVRHLGPERSLDEGLALIYRATAVLRAGGYTAAVDQLGPALATAETKAIVPYLELANGQLQLGRLAAAKRTLDGVLFRDPGQRLAREWRAVVDARLGRPEEAVEAFSRLADEFPDRAEPWFNLGVVRNALGQPAQAATALKQAIRARHNLAPAWVQLGNSYVALRRLDKAATSYRRALEIDPTDTGAYLALGEVLLLRNEVAEARRYWRHGIEVAGNPERISEALAQAARDPRFAALRD